MRAISATVLLAVVAALCGCDGEGEPHVDGEGPEDAQPTGPAELDPEPFSPRPLLESPALSWTANLGGASPNLAYLDDDRLYVVVFGGGLRCLDVETGRLLWSAPEEGQPLIDGSSVYLHHRPGGGPSPLRRRDALTGEELWLREADYQQRYNMALLDGRLYLGTDLAPDIAGRQAEQRILVIDASTGELERSVPVKPDPAAPFQLFTAGGELFLLSGGLLERLEPESLRTRWTLDLGENPDARAYADGQLYVATTGRLTRVSVDDGRAVELAALTGRAERLLVAGETVYSVEIEGDARYSSLFARRLVDGALRWSVRLPGRGSALQAVGETLHLLVTREDEGDWGFIDPVLARYRQLGEEMELVNLIFCLYTLKAADGEVLSRLDADYSLGGLLVDDHRLYLAAGGGRILCLERLALIQ